MESQVISVQKSARYAFSGNPDAENLLLVLHGYGQLSEYFIKNFEALSTTYLIVAPEGTHRFYLEGTSGRVAASWMTKELREIDIEENNLYLESLLEVLSKKYAFKTISLLGFSQGGATASRWISHSKFKFNRLILWACVFPEDILPDFDGDKWKFCEKHFVLGTEDEFFSGDKFQQMNSFYKKHDFDVINFEGKHKIDPKILNLLLKIEA